MSGVPLLTIAIPTFNRRRSLDQNLSKLLPQIAQSSDVEVLVTDNASTDGTSNLVEEYQKQFSNLQYRRNSTNLGFDGNFIAALQKSRGQYVALLSDDDYYAPGAIEEIVRHLGSATYAFAALNYVTVDRSGNRLRGYAPTVDRTFSPAIGLWDHPSVGHFSGLIYNRGTALAALDAYEAHQRETPLVCRSGRRGTFLEIAVLSMHRSSLPGLFVGREVLRVNQPPEGDHNTVGAGEKRIYEMLLDQVRFYTRLVNLGYYDADRMALRKSYLVGNIPGVMVRSWPLVARHRKREILEELDAEFGTLASYRRRYRPLIRLLEIGGLAKGLRAGLRLRSTFRSWRRERAA